MLAASDACFSSLTCCFVWSQRGALLLTNILLSVFESFDEKGTITKDTLNISEIYEVEKEHLLGSG